MALEYVTIGRILRPQGNTGAVRVDPFFPEPDFYLSIREVVLRKEERAVPVSITRSWQHGKFPIWHFQGCDSLATAAQWIGYSIELPQSAFGALPAGEYYWFEIEGLAVYTDTGMYIGRVEQVLNMGSSDLLQVTKNGAELLIPAIREVVKTIDLSAQRIIIQPLPGLLDDAGN
jgi:16S rRNA processing protein RimM